MLLAVSSENAVGGHAAVGNDHDHRSGLNVHELQLGLGLAPPGAEPYPVAQRP